MEKLSSAAIVVLLYYSVGINGNLGKINGTDGDFFKFLFLCGCSYIEWEDLYLQNLLVQTFLADQSSRMLLAKYFNCVNATFILKNFIAIECIRLFDIFKKMKKITRFAKTFKHQRKADEFVLDKVKGPFRHNRNVEILNQLATPATIFN